MLLINLLIHIEFFILDLYEYKNPFFGVLLTVREIGNCNLCPSDVFHQHNSQVGSLPNDKTIWAVPSSTQFKIAHWRKNLTLNLRPLTVIKLFDFLFLNLVICNFKAVFKLCYWIIIVLLQLCYCWKIVAFNLLWKGCICKLLLSSFNHIFLTWL